MKQQTGTDYQSIHAPGRSNFSSSSPHRMPTVSAAQALQELETSSTRCISTGLTGLDLALQNNDPLQVSTSADQSHGGISRGQLTEIYGPPGVGKTALGMHLAARVLHQNEDVVWVDASHPISGPRFSQILQTFSSSEPSTFHGLLKKFHHFSTPTLSHLLALLTHTTSNFPPQNTSLIVVDSFSTLIDSAFPRNVDSTSTPKRQGALNSASRKFPLLQYLINALQKLATTHNIAIIVLNQCVTKMRPGLGAALIPAISATAWEQGLGCRLALFRDWGWNDDEGNKVNGVRFAQVIRAEGVTLSEGRGKLAAFIIGELGLSSVTIPSSPTVASPSRGRSSLPKPQATIAIAPQKRKRAEFEIPDSDEEDDEDYGWAEEGEELPPMPPQWQGSEDILVPPPGELEADDAEEENDDVVEGTDYGDTNCEDFLPGENNTGPYEKELERDIPDSEDELAL
ncbi:7d6665dd-aa63-411c-8730-33229f84269d [Sclerotinia trifoliorum]|uniref:DNA repair protein RAD51 homolog 3 n=1 Tax=Sclerotinia trifoliorum TaxID=28548 RepID=A0A8H2W4X6_9HELO|nr:7d6665dd-aa63-411c-8730-33229f84269d [Sclerotinia trifoliorum]